jgi:hypothetical protein
MSSSPTSALKRILPVLNRSSVAYAVIGAVASGILGRPRATLDIDILVGGGSQGITKISSALKKAGAQEVESFLEANPMLRGMMVRMRMGLIHVDLIRSRDRHDGLALRRRQIVRAFGLRLLIPQPEDLILLKMKAGRERDLEDCIGIFEAQKDRIDLTYLWRWAVRLRLTDEYHYVVGSRQD